MSYDILRRELKQGVTRNLYLFYGPEEYLIKHYSSEIENLTVDPVAKDISFSFFDGKSEPGAVYDACAAYPMLGGKRFVVVRNCGIFKPGADGGDGEPADDKPKPKAAGRRRGIKSAANEKPVNEKAITYNSVVNSLPDYTCLLIIEREIDKRQTLFKQISARGLVVEFTYRTQNELGDWARAIAGKYGKQFMRDALGQFIANAGESMTAIKMELDKLIAYTGERKGITADDVNAVCEIPLSAKIFDLLENALAGQKKPALIQLDLLLREREPAMRILSTLSNHIVLLRQIKFMANNGAKLPDVVKLLNLNSYRAEKLWRQCARVSPEALTRAAEICRAQDMAVKSGIVGDVSALQTAVATI